MSRARETGLIFGGKTKWQMEEKFIMPVMDKGRWTVIICASKETYECYQENASLRR